MAEHPDGKPGMRQPAFALHQITHAGFAGTSGPLPHWAKRSMSVTSIVPLASVSKHLHSEASGVGVVAPVVMQA